MNYSRTWSDWHLRRFWSTKALFAGAQTVIAALVLIAAVLMSGLGNIY